MKLQTDNYRLGDTIDALKKSLMQLLPKMANQVNLVSEGRVAGSYSALASQPSVGLWAVGDFVRNSTPKMQGPSGAQYVVTGWMCIQSGQPGVWVPCRSLTGT